MSRFSAAESQTPNRTISDFRGGQTILFIQSSFVEISLTPIGHLYIIFGNKSNLLLARNFQRLFRLSTRPNNFTIQFLAF